MDSQSILAKYLSTYAEPIAQQAISLPKVYEHVVIVPCYAETYQSLQPNLEQPSFANNLMILVVNQPHSTTVPLNQQLIQQLTNSDNYQCIYSHETLVLLGNRDKSLDILIVDAYSKNQTLDLKQGVGAARKIGNDLALKLIQHNQIRQPWLFNTDADTTLPADYFKAIEQANSKTACLIFPYQHQLLDGKPQLNQAMEAYQNYLNHYVDGLKQAGSPYAWHSLGSILALSAQHYVAVRGIPKRSAGEDFHLLNKLTKVGAIQQLEQPIITIETRLSERVPFGTGPALAASLNGEPKKRYHPDSFSLLKLWLDSWQQLWDNRVTAQHNPTIHNVIEALSLNKLIEHSIKQSSDFETFSKHMHTGFDALKTLQFIRAADKSM